MSATLFVSGSYQSLKMLNSSIWNIPTTVWLALLALFLATFFFVRQIAATRKRYEGIMTLPTSWHLGALLGHMENFTRVGNRGRLTVILGEVCIGIGKVVHQMGEGLIYFRVGPFNHIVAAMNAKTAEALLSNYHNITKAKEYDFGKAWLGNGLLNGNGAHWRAHRKLITPTFNFAILKKFIPVMNSQMNTFCKIVDSKMNQNTGVSVVEDIRPLITNAAIDIICQTAMGLDMNAQRNWLDWITLGGNTKDRKRTERAAPAPGQVEYVEAFRTFLDIFITRLVRPWLHPELVFRFTPMGRRYYASIRSMHRFTNGVIEKRKTELEKLLHDKPTVESAMEFLGRGERLRFLDLLLVYHLKDPTTLDMVSVREEVDTFMVAGYDTTASTLQFAFLLLGHNADKQQLVHQELDDIFADDDGRDITADDIRRMVYLEMVIKEVLRLYPPATFFARLITEDFQCDRYIIPKGTTFLVFSYSIHRDPSVYEKPERFIPERFDPERGLLKKHPYSFIPFSAGPRNCIGQKYAMLELKIFLASVLRKYSIRSLTKQEEVKLNFAIISKSYNPIKIEFTKRQMVSKNEN